jgi:hypothetical protein
MTDIITLNPNVNIGNALMGDGTPTILDALLVQDCRMYFPRLPNTQFALQTITLPNITVNQVKQFTRYVDPNEIGEKVNYEPFTVSFIVDKYMKNWSEIFNWMKTMTANGTSVGTTDNPVLIIGNSPTLRFNGAWPTELGGLEFASTMPQAEYVKCNLTLNYDYVDYVGQYSTVDSSYT